MTSAAPSSRRAAARSAVVDLAQARDARRLRELGERCRAMDECARAIVSRLFRCGSIFSRHGSRMARDLLLSHQQLLRAAALIGRAGEADAAASDDPDALYQEASALVERSTLVVARCEAACARSQ